MHFVGYKLNQNKDNFRIPQSWWVCASSGWSLLSRVPIIPWALAHFMAEDIPGPSLLSTVSPPESCRSLRTTCSFEWRMVFRNQDLTLRVLVAPGCNGSQVLSVDTLKHKCMPILLPFLVYWKLCTQTNTSASNSIYCTLSLHSGGFSLRVLMLIS